MNDTHRPALASLTGPYEAETPEAKGLFQAAMAEADAWHTEHNPTYAKLWNGEERPVLPVGLFKTLALDTPVDAPGAWLASSGTGGSATRVYYDAPSMARIEKGMLNIFVRNGLFSQEPSRFLLLSPDPSKAAHAGYATAFLKFTGCAPQQEVVFCVDENGRFDPELAWSTLASWAGDGAPVFIFGLTVFFEQLYLGRQQPLVLRCPVRGLTGGGWKGLTKTLERNDTVAGLQRLLQGPLTDIRDIYGLTEHPLHYVSCSKGNFHIPLYSRFMIEDAAGHGVAEGQAGIIRLQNPFFASLPAHDLLTEDGGLWGRHCACGEALPFIQYLGRLSEPVGTCAHQVAEKS